MELSQKCSRNTPAARSDGIRVTAMSRIYERAARRMAALRSARGAGWASPRFARLRADIALLDEYQRSGCGQQDFEADEAGALPARTRRSVLSEDGLYDLLREYDELIQSQ